jgi:hypothetical protein
VHASFLTARPQHMGLDGEMTAAMIDEVYGILAADATDAADAYDAADTADAADAADAADSTDAADDDGGIKRNPVRVHDKRKLRLEIKVSVLAYTLCFCLLLTVGL